MEILKITKRAREHGQLFSGNKGTGPSEDLGYFAGPVSCFQFMTIWCLFVFVVVFFCLFVFFVLFFFYNFLLMLFYGKQCFDGNK